MSFNTLFVAVLACLSFSAFSEAGTCDTEDFGIVYDGSTVFTVTHNTSTCSCVGGFATGANSTSSFGGVVSINAPPSSSQPALSVSSASTAGALSVQGAFSLNGYDMLATLTALSAQLASVLITVNSVATNSPAGGLITIFNEPFVGTGLPGWTFTNSPSAQFQIGPAVYSSCGSGKGNDPAADHSSPASNLLGCVIGGCYVQTGTAYNTYATSPIIDTSQCASPNATLTFWRVLGSSPNNHNVIDILTAANNWVNIYDSVGGIAGASWAETTWSSKTYSILHNSYSLFQLRWGLQEAAAGNPDGAGWSVDDITLTCMGKQATNKTFTWNFSLGTRVTTWYVKLVNASITSASVLSAQIDGLAVARPTIRTVAGDRVLGWWETLDLAGSMSAGVPAVVHVVSITLDQSSYELRSPSYVGLTSVPGSLPLIVATQAP
eukprot:TRINITY_DN913_c0_g1_i1.p1 TRINITY_DN913_c0_g1~~TRINITY_DN913_c0_g1_i1.p1  ORF type:complete len:436 (+),score=130.76 TRINITY_DN913_c0_g1_i1:119-1426(+)